jgi:phosphoribosylamine--glycine ligase
MGDPETEVVIPRIKNDLVELLQATARQKLENIQLEIDPRFTTTIVTVSGGYPNEHKTGFEISGLNLAKKTVLFFIPAQKRGQ